MRDGGAPDDGADFVIVGSGAAGATAALVLAEAGRDVLVLEEGEWSRPEEREAALLPSLARLYRDAGLQVSLGRAPMPVLQGRCVGGTTAVNAAIMWRLPEDVHAAWCAEDPAIASAMPYEALDRRMDEIERALGVRPVEPAVFGRNDALMAAGAAALGIEGRTIRRAEEGCEGSGRCIQGCPRSRKRSMDATYLPRAAALGARVRAGARAERVAVERGRAAGVVLASGERVRARRAVLLAASAVQTPCILRRSGLRGLAGERFQCHPGVALLGVFDDPVRAWEGATQAWESAAFRATRRFKLEALGLPPELLAARLPGTGRALAEALDAIDRVACWAAQVRAGALGSVRPAASGRARIRYSPAPRDVAVAGDALLTLAEMMFAAGARAVFPGIAGLPERLGPADLGRLRARRLPRDPAAWSFVATHLFGTARMSGDPRAGVVRPGDLECREVRGLHVIDSSVFPTNLGVNPQESIMAVAAHAAGVIAARESEGREMRAPCIRPYFTVW